MKLFTKCRTCKNEISFRNSSGTRVELAMNDGEYIELSCKECLTKNKYSVNDIRTKKSKLIEIIAVFTLLIGTPLLAFIGYRHMHLTIGAGKSAVLLLIPVLVYSILKKQDRMRVNTFNNGYL